MCCCILSARAGSAKNLCESCCAWKPHCVGRNGQELSAEWLAFPGPRVSLSCPLDRQVIVKYNSVFYLEIIMDQSQSSQTEEKSGIESSLLERIPEISQLSLRPGRQISSSSSIINSNSFDASQFVKENIEQIKTDPFALISDETTRQTLFKMIYILEQQNTDLISKFEANKPYIIKEENIGNKYELQSAKKDEREAIIKELKNRNARHVGQVKLLEMYRDQKQRLMREINDKNKKIDQLMIQKNAKQVKCRQLDNQLKESSERLLKLKQKKNRIYDDIHRKKNNEKMADSGVIDRLLGEYYETIKEVMDDDQSVERINKNTKIALSQIGKGKAGGFTSFLEGIESNKLK